MSRPRIEGMDERIIESFISRNVYSNQREVISAALRALVREQKIKDAMKRKSNQEFTDETYISQIQNEVEKENASVGNTHRSTTIR